MCVAFEDCSAYTVMNKFYGKPQLIEFCHRAKDELQMYVVILFSPLALSFVVIQLISIDHSIQRKLAHLNPTSHYIEYELFALFDL